MNQISNKSGRTFLFFTGLVSTLGQVVLLRELHVASFGVELIYALAFAFWLAGAALGAMTGKKKYVPSDKMLSAFFSIAGILLIAEIIFIRRSHGLFGGVPGAFLPFDKQLMALTAALIPFSGIMGLLFQWSAKLFTRSGHTLAGAYSAECIGGLVGGGASSFFAYCGMQNLTIALLCSLVCLLMFLPLTKKKSFRPIRLISLIALFAFLIANSRYLDAWIAGLTNGRGGEFTDTPYNRILVTKQAKQLSVLSDNALVYESETTDAEEFVQLVALQAVKLDRVLVLGGGYKGIIAQLQRLPVSRIDYVEFDEKMFRFVSARLSPEEQTALAAQNVHVLYRDPRSFLNEENTYDLIVAGYPEPASGQTSRFYTKEFFRQIFCRLSGNGVFGFSLPSSENYWTPALRKRNATIFRALAAAFPQIQVLPGTTNIFIASKGPLTEDQAILSDRLYARRGDNRIVIPEYVWYLYTTERYTEIKQMLNDASASVNSDMRPICYQYTLAIWLSKFFPGIAQVDSWPPEIIHPYVYLTIALLCLAVMVLFAKKKNAVRRNVVVFFAGFQGMVMELALLLCYQIQNGILYQAIGLLIMAFMAGLAIGAWFVGKQAGGHGVLRIILLASSALFLLAGYSVGISSVSGLAAVFFALCFCGFVTSALFAWASNLAEAGKVVPISSLYAFDLAGGVLGALLTDIVLIPMFGIPWTFAMGAGVSAFLLLVV